jgi:uncharacterized protein involved in response to NO
LDRLVGRLLGVVIRTMPTDRPTRNVIPLKSQPPKAASPQAMSPAQAREHARLHKQPWRLALLLHAPHRLAFASAIAMMTSVSLWWWMVLLNRAHGAWNMNMVVPDTFVHAVLMTLGFMPLFFVGFLFTAGPKWLRLPDVGARQILPGVATMLTGWVVLLAGAYLHAAMAALGMGLVALGWALLAGRFVGMVRRSPAPDRLHATLIAVASTVGLLIMVVAALGLATQNFAWVRMVALLALWWFITPVYGVVAHRMIPFFSASAVPSLDAWRPNWLLWTLLGVVFMQGGWVCLEWLSSQTPTWLLIVRVVTSLLSGVSLLALAVRWGLWRSLRNRLLAMLHLGFVWLGVAFCLDAFTVGMRLRGVDIPTLLPLHALTMGFLGSLLLAMVTRVSCGHSGRTLVADALAWGLFWALQLATVLRLLATLWPAQAEHLLVAAATAWLSTLLVWGARHGRWYGQPRVDGRPG